MSEVYKVIYNALVISQPGLFVNIDENIDQGGNSTWIASVISDDEIDAHPAFVEIDDFSDRIDCRFVPCNVSKAKVLVFKERRELMLFLDDVIKAM